MKNDTPHACQMNAASLERTAGGLQEFFRTLLDLVCSRLQAIVVEAAVLPVTMGAENARPLSTTGITRAIETAGDKKTGQIPVLFFISEAYALLIVPDACIQ